MTTQSLNSIVDIILNISPMAAARNGFNEGLIVGPSAVIPSSERLRLYTDISAMLTDGFTTGDPEYLAAQLYVNTISLYHGTGAAYKLWIGRQDLTTDGLWNVAINVAGTGYKVGDIVGISGGTGGSVTVLSITGGGSTGPVGSIVVNVPGTGYTVTTGELTTGGTGTGLTVNITAVGESPLIALQACRSANNQWYACMVTDAAKSDHELIAAWIQSAQPSSVYFYTTQDSDCITTAGTDIFTALKGLNYNRVIGQYSTENAYAIAGIKGYAMGENTGLANSAYTLKFKQESGVLPEPLTATQINTVEGNNGNLLLSYGNSYTFFEQGVMANGQFFDEIINLDMLGNNIQLNVMDLLYGVNKVPQTDGGTNQLIHVIDQALDASVTQGFIAPGIWRGQPVLGLQTGQMLPKGYIVLAEPVAQQSDADRQARKSVPIYICIAEAGAVHSVVVQLNVAR